MSKQNCVRQQPLVVDEEKKKDCRRGRRGTYGNDTSDPRPTPHVQKLVTCLSRCAWMLYYQICVNVSLQHKVVCCPESYLQELLIIQTKSWHPFDSELSWLYCISNFEGLRCPSHTWATRSSVVEGSGWILNTCKGSLMRNETVNTGATLLFTSIKKKSHRGQTELGSLGSSHWATAEGRIIKVPLYHEGSIQLCFRETATED